MNDSTLEKIKNNFNLISSIALTIIGIVGNLLVVYILTRKYFRKQSMFRYLVFATVVDTFNILSTWPIIYANFFQLNNLELNCKVFFYAVYVGFQFSPLLILVSTIDRYITVKGTIMFVFRKKLKYQILVILAIFLSLLAIDSPFFIYYKLGANETGCQPINVTTSTYLDILDGLIAAVIPFVLMILFNSLIACKLINQKAKLHQNRRKIKKDTLHFKTTCAICLYFLFCNLPFCIFTVTNDLLGIDYIGTFTFFILNTLTYVYSSCNLFVYILANRIFRNHFKQMVRLIKKPNRVGNFTQSSNRTRAHQTFTEETFGL